MYANQLLGLESQETLRVWRMRGLDHKAVSEYVCRGVLPSSAQALAHILTAFPRKPSAASGAGSRGHHIHHMHMHQLPQYPAPVAKKAVFNVSQGEEKRLCIVQMSANPCRVTHTHTQNQHTNFV